MIDYQWWLIIDYFDQQSWLIINDNQSPMKINHQWKSISNWLLIIIDNRSPMIIDHQWLSVINENRSSLINNDLHLTSSSVTNLVDQHLSARDNLLLKLQLLSQLVFTIVWTRSKSGKFSQKFEQDQNQESFHNNLKIKKVFLHLRENLLEQKYRIAVLAKSNLGNNIEYLERIDRDIASDNDQLNHVFQMTTKDTSWDSGDGDLPRDPWRDFRKPSGRGIEVSPMFVYQN